jgi:hypothetical protein
VRISTLPVSGLWQSFLSAYEHPPNVSHNWTTGLDSYETRRWRAGTTMPPFKLMLGPKLEEKR